MATLIPNSAQNAQEQEVFFDPINFRTYDFFPYQRGVLWYFGFAIILFALTATLIKVSAITAASLLVLVSGFYLASIQSQPQQIDVSISASQVQVANQTTELKDFSSFWLEAHSQTNGFIHFYKSGSFWSHKSIVYLSVPTLEIEDKLSQVMPQNTSSLSHGIIFLSHLLKI